MVLCECLNQWLKPYMVQAGAQKKRGYMEHVVTLRLITNTARLNRTKLFIVFVDFSKAYDIVPRHKLFMLMKGLGCGAVMLAAVMAMYRITECYWFCYINCLTRSQARFSHLLFIVYNVC